MSVVRQHLEGTARGRPRASPIQGAVLPFASESPVPVWAWKTGALSLTTHPGVTFERYASTRALSEAVEELRHEWQVSGVQVADPRPLWSYLLRHPRMGVLVRDLLRAVRERFPEARVAVHLYRDPEVSDDEYVRVCLRFPTYPEDCLKKIRALEESFLAQLRSEEGWVVLTTDFHPVD